MQLKHAVAAQGSPDAWNFSLTPIFILTHNTSSINGLISSLYAMLLNTYLHDCPCSALEQWVTDVGAMEADQWEREFIRLSSLNVSQRLSQLYLF